MNQINKNQTQLGNAKESQMVGGPAIVKIYMYDKIDKNKNNAKTIIYIQ